MMRRIWLLTLMLLVPVLLLGFVIGSNLRLKPEAQATSLLAHYRSVRGEKAGLSIIKTTKSRDPGQFVASMSQSSYSEGWYYGADHLLSMTALPVPTGTGIETIDSPGSGMRAMPYPPVEAWCVELRSSDNSTFTVVLAEHQDLYNAEWAVHELPADSQQMQAILKQIGCN